MQSFNRRRPVVSLWLVAAVTAVAGLLPPTPVAAAAAGGWVDLQELQVRLIAAQDALDADGGALLGLQIRLAPDWKTYWREPGESGLPPRLDWSESGNLAAATVAFPAPARFDSFGFLGLGYAGEVVLPLRLRAADAGRPLAARLALELMVCREICVPHHASLALDLPPGPAAPTAHAATIAAYLARVPEPPEAAGMRIEAVAVDGRHLRVEASATAPFRNPDLLVEAQGRVGFGPALVELAGDRRRAVLRLPLADGVESLGGELVLTLTDGTRAVQQAWRLPDG